MKKKCILLMDIGTPWGGVETYVRSLAEILDGHADLYSICALPELAADLRARGVHVLCVPIMGHRWMNFVRFLVVAAIFPFFLVKHRIEIVQLNGYLESLLALPARMLGCVAVRTSHGPSEVELYTWYRQPTKYFPRLASRAFLKLANKVVSVSEVVGAEVARRVPAERRVVIPNWVAQLPEERARPQLQDPVRLLYVGRLERYKGLGLLLQAMRGVPNLHLTVAGKGSDLADFEREAAGLQVEFVGFSANTPEFYQNADIFVNPSMGPEGLPIVSLESMAYGLPCLFSKLPVHREISGDGEATALFEIGDVEDLRLQLERLVTDADRRKLFSGKARARIDQFYSPRAATAAYLEVFDVGAGAR